MKMESGGKSRDIKWSNINFVVHATNKKILSNCWGEVNFFLKH